MRQYAFNGDADGLCALQQLRLAEPSEAALVTGVKRDIELLRRVDAAPGDLVTVLDVSLDRNRPDLLRVLAAGASVRYFDHHYAGEIPQHPRFEPHIKQGADLCTGILVDRYLEGRHRGWAIVAAFGDGLDDVGTSMAHVAGLNAVATATLAKLGQNLNYNAYGSSISDLHFHPLALAAEMLPFDDPLAFAERSSTFEQLDARYEADMHKARSLQMTRAVTGAAMLILPDESWARRVVGTFANELARSRPDDAVAVLLPNQRGGYAVSVRVRVGSPVGADEFCREFTTGGGRRQAAGIDHLADAEVEHFGARFFERFSTR